VDDQVVRAEAQAAATEAGVGYVSINVFHQRPGTAILHKFGFLTTPAVLVVKRPGVVYSKFPGFVDRDVVEQAVADAR
jgi:thiol:disulfide interchange protein